MLGNLEKKKIWKYFIELSGIPRPSKHEERVIEYITNFAAQRGLDFIRDKAGNLLVRKNAFPGKENSPVVVLQSHVDMVCEKNQNIRHDFLKDPLKLYVEDDFIMAEGTTLGADNGIGVAASLAVLDSDDVPHGPLECLFTVDEETGLTGAKELDEDLLKGRILVNLDTEEDGCVYIGCAGGKTTELNRQITEKQDNDKELAFQVCIERLKGGHSGLHISTGRANAILLLSRFLWNLNDKINFDLSCFSGGDKHNAVPREASATICLKEEDLPVFETELVKYNEIYRNEFAHTDPEVCLKSIKAERPEKVLTEKYKTSFLNIVYSFPNGVLSMDPCIEGLVQTSTNLAAVKINGDSINILTSQRSSVESMVLDASGKVIAHCLSDNYDFISKDPYPAWTPDTDSELLALTKSVHLSIFGKEPAVKAVHAGLECGIIAKKYPGMDMISIGPDIFGAHSPDERMRISSVDNFWRFLTGMLEQIQN